MKKNGVEKFPIKAKLSDGTWKTINVNQCPLCGGTMKLIHEQNWNSAYLACESCRMKSPVLWKGASGESGMMDTLTDRFNHTIYDDAIHELNKRNQDLTELLNEFKWRESDCMMRSYTMLNIRNNMTKSCLEAQMVQ